jgi:tRNA threonylcarbamoyl adenosine modification protein YeaZ
MLVLAIETSVERGSVALGSLGLVVHEIELSGKAKHSQELFPALAKLGLPRLQISRVVVGLGPGSFSGIRVALAAAHGIAFAQQVPVWGVCSACAVGLRMREVTRLGVFADARRGQIYCTVFSQGDLERATYLIDAAALPDEMSKMTLAVTAEDALAINEKALPHARDLVALPDHFPHWVKENLEPIYLREATHQA